MQYVSESRYYKKGFRAVPKGYLPQCPSLRDRYDGRVGSNLTIEQGAAGDWAAVLKALGQ